MSKSGTIERRFKGRVGWAPLTDYISITQDGVGYVVYKDDPTLFRANGQVERCEAYNLEYCLAMVECGAWEELGPLTWL